MTIWISVLAVIFGAFTGAIALKLWLRLFRPRLHNTTFKLEHEDISFMTEDGLTLSGWYYGGNQAKPIVVLVHGITGNKSELLPLAYPLAQQGFGIFLFDLRAHGESQGKRTSYGFYERLDVLAALTFLKENNHLVRRQIVFYGLSMGAVAILLAGKAIQERGISVKAIAADSSFARFSPIMRADFNTWPFFLRAPTIALVSALVKKLYRIPLESINPIESIDTFKNCRWLFMHSKADELIPYQNAHSLYEAAKEPKEIYCFDLVPHADGFLAYQKQYISKLVKLFEDRS